MAGFFEFSLMRIRDDLDQKLLAELFYQYLNVEEEFIKALFTEGETQLGRVFVQEAALKNSAALQVLDYERATEVIDTSEQIGISLCYCRHKMKHVGKNCDAPMDICMTLNGSAGMDKTLVTPGLNRRSPNSLMLTGLVDGQRRTAVWGGLGNEAFGKFAILQDGSPTFYAHDPIGRLVDEEETYIARDTFYMDVHTRDPFDALERYGRTMRIANSASPNVYDFPVLCGWSVSHISKLPNVNNSAKLIGELNCGHTYVTTGELPRVDRVQVNQLVWKNPRAKICHRPASLALGHQDSRAHRPS